MRNKTILCVPRTEAIRYAGEYLAVSGLHVTRTAAPDITHVLLPVPSFSTGDEFLAHLLADLPSNAIICGGNLFSPLLKGMTVIDFLQDPFYLAENAALTASCALQLMDNSTISPDSCCVLVIGWGRIGKCLTHLLKQKGIPCSVAARKAADRAMIHALGYRAISIEQARKETNHYDVILNTVPAMVLPDIQAKEHALLIELASTPGMSGSEICNCRGLPNKMAPEASGKLIAETFLRLTASQED